MRKKSYTLTFMTVQIRFGLNGQANFLFNRILVRR